MTVPEGHLPVFSVDTEEDARLLIGSACRLGFTGEYIAEELAAAQTLDSLFAFSARLAETWFDRLGREPERLAERMEEQKP